MNAIIESLCGPGGPGLSGNLVDSEGFPRADIEFRLFDRNVIGSLDHKGITESCSLAPKSSDMSVSLSENTSQDSSTIEEAFGNVENGDNLQSRLVAEAQSNQGNPIPLVIVRQGALMNITVAPRPWHGPGSLGCHFRILWLSSCDDELVIFI
ncbi:uncharacterized protein LOC108951276 [Musa acuminata AAA Group]|uniref:uncharacterized protein LOC135593032 n=1 Tax=Musa acuminata AAA Group TaxID=214697 RepID=UPI0031CF0244